jgi:4'-phosphopantetheinyl transferase
MHGGLPPPPQRKGLTTAIEHAVAPLPGRGRYPITTFNDTVSLWWAPLDVSASELGGLASCLSRGERVRANRFSAPLDRSRFVAARGWLRRLLAGQLGCAPDQVRIDAGDGGKPRLADADLSFNTAVSAGVAVYATSWSMEVGVDVEAIRAIPDADAVAARFFSAAEQRALASLPEPPRREAFFRCWTRKEAYLKGIGVGLTVPTDAVEVGVGGGPVTFSGWSVHDLGVAPGFAAAVAFAPKRCKSSGNVTKA